MMQSDGHPTVHNYNHLQYRNPTIEYLNHEDHDISAISSLFTYGLCDSTRPD